MLKLLFILLFSTQILGQNYFVKGTIKDSLTHLPLPLTNIYVENLEIGTTSDKYGDFSLIFTQPGFYLLQFTFVGYKTITKEILVDKNKFIEVLLEPLQIEIGQLTIIGSHPKFRETPVAFSELTSKDVDISLGSKEAVFILERTPNAYVSQQGGGIGEQRLSIRGFDQTNISVMINGIPINNPENGEIYWSNWAGISDLIDYVYVQRGLSAIPYSTLSVGGSVNFVTTNSISNETSLKFKSQLGSDNLIKSSFSFTTKLAENIGLTGLISKRKLDGFADQVYSDELTYFISVGMIFNDHAIQVQLLGSPQKHGQRLSPQTISDWSNYGKNYNADWGYLKGQPLNLRDNEFHNPMLSLNHNWQISNNLVWTTLVSLSRGSGGGTVPPWFPLLAKTGAGQIDFDKEWLINSNNVDSNYHNSLNKSEVALRKGVHKNYRGSIIFVFKYDVNNFSFSGGLDGKYYEAQNYNQLSNLLGGDYQIWSNDVNADPNKLLKVGDKVDFNADSFTRNYGSFLQVEYKQNKISAYLNLAISNTEYNRIDYFNFLTNDENRETGWKSFTSKTLKAGIKYNLDPNNNFYFNIGNFSRTPLSMNVFDYGNNQYQNVKNEKILSFEVGYGLKNEFSQFNINYFTTSWKDKAFSQVFVGSETNSLYYYSLFGASARHTGIEFDGRLAITDKLSLNSMFAYSSNKWENNIDASIRPESNPVDEIKYYAYTENLYVGNFPMISASLGFYYENEIKAGLIWYINPKSNFYGKYYSTFIPELRTNLNEKNIQPWKIPDFYIIDLHTGVKFDMTNLFIKSIGISLDLFNILDQENIIDAVDGISHDSKTATVWYGRGRWWNLSLSLLF